ncbi:hypothetical protein NDU88_013086 [Pleurodeles waltl]|uniref:Uncharacterized protein n=1 Tax=Pleurodeles waltl TaxID=8319 RepID=A0AAV7R3F0_PLEWA|nr:hypothetical protein NDU88_013086 [Pleurodeles waltl]
MEAALRLGRPSLPAAVVDLLAAPGLAVLDLTSLEAEVEPVPVSGRFRITDHQMLNRSYKAPPGRLELVEDLQGCLECKEVDLQARLESAEDIYNLEASTSTKVEDEITGNRERGEQGVKIQSQKALKDKLAGKRQALVKIQNTGCVSPGCKNTAYRGERTRQVCTGEECSRRARGWRATHVRLYDESKSLRVLLVAAYSPASKKR